MNFVIVFLMVYCLQLLQSESVLRKEKKVKIQLPRPIMHASSVIISGTLYVNSAELRATITGKGLGEEECNIGIRPNDNEIVIGGLNDSYCFNIEKGKEVIPFTLMITAWSYPDENIDSLHLEFNGNEAGLQSLNNPCKFKSFSAVDKIVLEGFKHIRNLTFLYEDEDESDS